jgi:hypothetical protein
MLNLNLYLWKINFQEKNQFMFKKALYAGLLAIFTLSMSTSLSSCKAKEGCGLEDKYGAKTGKNGQLSTKRGKSNLFSKKTRKKMKKRGQG